ncbi:MAG: VWA domain-containing protein [Pseudomonadota bacterium]
MPEFIYPAWLVALAVLPAIAWAARYRSGTASTRLWIGTALRCLAVATLVVALAGPITHSASNRVTVVFALDQSASIDADAFDRSLEWVRNAVAIKPAQTDVGVVVFGASAAVEQAPAAELTIDGTVQSFVDQDATDIGAAIELALATLPTGGQRRIVVVSDGAETEGDARGSAAAAHALGVELFAVALESQTRSDIVRLDHISSPDWVHANEPFEIQASVHSHSQTRASITVLRDGGVVYQAETQLQAGNNVIDVADRIPNPGLREYEVLVSSDADAQLENNRFSTFIDVRGPPRALHVYTEATEADVLTAALQVQGLNVEAVTASRFPSTQRALYDFDLIILNNVSGYDLSLAKMQALEHYVRDGGGGVITVGGDRAYAAGGYYATPLETLLPVDMDIQVDAAIPVAAVTILLDKSGSMSSQVDGEQKLAIARRAALAAIEVLNPLDQIGVLAFDSTFDWAVQPTLAGERRAIVDSLQAMTVGGGTRLYPALREAHRMARSQQAKVKHLIVLSDGLAESDEDFVALSREIAASDITVSTVAFGAGADQQLMQVIADIGGGRYYYAKDLQHVPRIFTSETLTVTRDLFVEARVTPETRDGHAILSGIEPTAVPALSGYQRTWPKPAAQTLLSAGDDPLLSVWRYGLGRSAAFMSDLSGRWGAAWTEWPQFPQLAAQLARWTMRQQNAGQLSAGFAVQDQTATLSVDALDGDDRFLNGLTLSASISDASGTATTTPLDQVASGRYEATFPVAAGKQYVVSVSAQRDAIPTKVFALAVPYSPEFQNAGLNLPLLEDLARESGGDVMSLSRQPLEAILAPSANSTEAQRIWWPFLGLVLLFLMLEVVVRRVR